MSSDLIGRRRIVQERLERARALEISLQNQTEILTETTGLSIEQLDFDGSFRAALTALTALAARRTTFDVIVTLPDAPFAIRIQHLNNSVSAEVVVPRDGPYPSVPNQPPAPVPVQAVAWESEQPAPTAPSTPSTPALGYIEPASDEVAADLAALLWQNVDDKPHDRNAS
jgi:hypothetical protein